MSNIIIHKTSKTETYYRKYTLKPDEQMSAIDKLSLTKKTVASSHIKLIRQDTNRA